MSMTKRAYEEYLDREDAREAARVWQDRMRKYGIRSGGLTLTWGTAWAMIARLG